MSLVEVMVAMGLTGLVLVGAMQMMTTSLRSQKTVQSGGDFSQLVSQISMILNNKNQCTTSLGNAGQATINPASSSEQAIKVFQPGSSATVAETGKDLGMITVTKMAISSLSLIDASKKLYAAKLRLDAERKGTGGNAALGSRNLGADFAVNLQFDASNRIASCYGEFSNEDFARTSCEQLGGVYTPGGTVPCQLTQALAITAEDFCLKGDPTRCLSSLPPPAKNLVNKQHTEDQCTAIGGTVVSSGTNTFCKFSGGCPAGWAQYLQWSATTSVYCADTTGIGCLTDYQGCTTGSHVWSSTAIETCLYALYTQKFSCDNGKTIYDGQATCTATLVAMGCY